MSRQRPVLAWNNEYCRHCFGCIAMCVRGALTLDHDRGCLSYNIRKCIRCGNCLRAPARCMWSRLQRNDA